MLPYQIIGGGRFQLTTALIASGVDVEVQSQNPPDFIIARSIGNAAATSGWGEANDAQPIEFWWERGMNQGTAKGILQSSAALNSPAMTACLVSANGISTYDTANPPTFAGLATTAITGSAGTFVVTMANTGTISVGDLVRLYGTTGELQIAGYTFQVTAVTANVSITLGYMASSGITFAADATAGTVVKFIPNRMYPRYRYIANITQATQAVVYFTEKNDFTPGEMVSFRVSSDFGMDEINNKTARVLSVTNSATVSSITLDLDTSGYTAFAFPTSAVAAAGVSPAVCVPASSGVVPFNGSATIPQQPPGTNLLDSFDNRNVRLIHFGAGLWNIASFGADAEDYWMWQAFKYDKYDIGSIN
jgi:hypothetical protein